MPRNPTAPPLPDSPSTWLANFRYRGGDSGERFSPETLGSRIGVSGATVRRWEAGQSNPSEEDLLRFADVCRLSPHQREFLLRVFARVALSARGGPKNFRDEATQVLAKEPCACLVDELFYIRAWNDGFASHAGELVSALPGGLNTVHLALTVGRRSKPELEDLRVRGIVRQMWMWTAHLATFPAYAALVKELMVHDAFAANWQAIIDEADDDFTPPLVMPALEGETDEGPFTVHAGEVLFPPLYRVFVCQPASPGATVRDSGRLSAVHFADRLHWSE